MFKTLAITAVAIVASASIASADSYISNFVMEQDRGTQVELGTVLSEGNGVVEVYAFHRGEVGALLGTESVNAGANTDVDVNILRPATNAIAYLKVGGQIVDAQEIDFN